MIYVQINTISKLHIINLLQNLCFKLCFKISFKLYFKLCFNFGFQSMFQSVFQSVFQLHVSIYILITSISTKGIILFCNYKFVSRVSFTKGSTSVLRRIIISLASWQLSIYSLNFH